VIFISIGEDEIANLRTIMNNDVFGEENFIAQIVWERAYAPVNLKRHFSESHDYILCYAKNFDKIGEFTLKRSELSDGRYKNTDKDPRGPWKSSDFSV
jgi:adenine-specific DNA-methyltransferase